MLPYAILCAPNTTIIKEYAFMHNSLMHLVLLDTPSRMFLPFRQLNARLIFSRNLSDGYFLDFRAAMFLRKIGHFIGETLFYSHTPAWKDYTYSQGQCCSCRETYGQRHWYGKPCHGLEIVLEGNVDNVNTHGNVF